MTTSHQDDSPIEHKTTVQHLLLLLLVSVIAFGFLRTPGTADVDTFMHWTDQALTQGIVNGYHDIEEDYPPLTMALLYGTGKISHSLGLELRFGFKLLLYVCLIASTLTFWRWTKNVTWAALFELSLVLSSVALGYTDITYTPTLLLSLWALQRRKYVLFTLLFGVSCLMKWQPIIIAPILLIYILNIDGWHEWRQIDKKRLATQILLPALIVTLLLFAVFGPEIYRAFERASSDELLSGNALNFNWIITHYLRQYHNWFGGLDDGLATWVVTKDWRITAIPKLLFAGSYLVACYLYWRRPKTFKNAIFYSLLGFLGYFMFNTGAHENHLYIAALLAAILFALDGRYAITFAIWTIAANFNLFYFYGTAGQNIPFSRVVFIDIALPLSIVYLMLYLALFIPAFRQDPHWTQKQPAGSGECSIQPDLPLVERIK